MDAYRVDMAEVLKAAAKYQAAGPVILAETAKGLTKMGLVVEARAKELTPVDTGTLRRSLTTQAATPGQLVAIVGTNVPYAAHVEYGTRAHFPPVAAIANWGPVRRGEVSAFVVARAISRRGTRERRFLRGALEQKTGAMLAIAQGIPGEILKRLGAK